MTTRGRCAGRGRLVGPSLVAIVVGGLGALVALPPDACAQPSSGGPRQVEVHRTLLDRYCVTCHNERLRTAGLTLDMDTLDLRNPARHAAVWEKVSRKLRAGTMPPFGRPRPDPGAAEAFVTWLEARLDAAAGAAPSPGRTEALHRLNRREYGFVIRDLLALEPVDFDLLLPADDTSYGFDNIAGVLGMSPAAMERYVAAARAVSQLAVGDPSVPPTSDSYAPPSDRSQDRQVPGLPLGTRGGLSVRRYFPLDAEYVVDVELAGLRRVAGVHTLEIALDGEPVHAVAIGGEAASAPGGRGAALTVRLPVRAGAHDLRVTFVEKSAAAAETLLQPFFKPRRFGLGGQPYVSRVEVSGPYGAAGPGDTPSRRRIFSCRPTSSGDEGPCARRILATLARRAFRRPVIARDLDLLMPFYAAGRRAGGFERGIQAGLERILVSPEFLFRIERDPVDATPGMVYPVSDLELASRLSFFLWSSIPDDELLAVAAAGELSDPGVLEQQVRRLLADPRSAALVRNFAGQWLHLRNLDAVVPDSVRFPDFDEGLREAFRQETERLVASVLREDRSVVELLSANYTFVNERLARHYGMPGVYGTHFRRVSADDRRRGLLGHGSILTVTSYAHRTSPVLRGKWILENVLGSPPPAPPPDVPALAETTAQGDPLSMREAMARHRASPACASCHASMDPLGLALEHFDAVGRWRAASEAGTPIDASGRLPGGERFEGVGGLRARLASNPRPFLTTVTEKLLTYALGRGLDERDGPAVRAILRAASADDDTLSALILGIARSVPFQMRRAAS